MVGEGGRLPLPWLRTALDDALEHQRGHALLVHGAPGIGAFEFVQSLAQAWLCEAHRGPRPCGSCGSCRLVQSHTHPDLRVVMPEDEAVSRGWPVDVDEKRKPSRQIRIDDVRGALDWIVTTAARGRAKVLVLFPAEAMNATAASALLKTLEEPPGGTRILLSATEPALLMPTVRSRCQHVVLPPPAAPDAVRWLTEQDVAGAEVLLAAAGGQPLEALRMLRQGIDAELWTSLPRRLVQGDAGALAGWSVPAALEALLKLCHDAMVAGSGGTPRYFPAASVPLVGQPERLVAWHKSLQRMQLHADHPWNEGLAIEALIAEVREVFAVGSRSRRPGSATLDTLNR